MGETTLKLYELLANLLIVLLGALGLMRGAEMVIRGDRTMTNTSDIYAKLSQYADIQSIGWLLITASIVLLVSVFVKGNASLILLIIGGLVAGSVHLFYGLIAIDSAKMVSTYYTNLTLGIYQYILVTIGAISLWKIKQNKD